MDTGTNPKISVCVPIHPMKNAAFFLRRLIESIEKQTFKDYEIIITSDGKMAENSNSAIRKAKGEIIKILYMDDFLAHSDSLQVIADNFKGGWLATGCLHTDGNSISNPHFPAWSHEVAKGVNTIGSPSVIAMENNNPPLFDENLSWLLDCELFGRLYEHYGPPTLVNDLNVVMGVGSHQMTNILTNEQKMSEQEYLNKKYGK